MPCLRRRVHPIIVAAVRIANRQCRELRIRHIVQTGDVDRDEIAADLRDMTAAEWPQAAMLAEQVMALLGGKLVVRQCVLASQQAKRRGLDDRAPGPRLPADRAVALTGAGAEIDVPRSDR